MHQDATMTLPHDIKSKKHKRLSHCFMKPSLSMNALPPEVRENSELSPARLRVDRPYNSLKKKRDSDKTVWRRSWESGHSHSSCSLQSNITNAVSGNGKDDFWAALQTNYNYIMDTNLLDSCREASGELEGVKSTEVKIPVCCQKSICQSARSQGSYIGDPRRLRRWLREMENRISKTPHLLEAMKLRINDLEKLIRQHSILHREIASQARSVAVCIRNSEKENSSEERPDSLKDINISNSNSNDKNEDISISPSGSRRSESGLRGLERRYHLLYLRAIEVQCMLENILESHQSSASCLKNDTDEEPDAKVARLNDAKFFHGFEDDEKQDDAWINTRGEHAITETFLRQEPGFEADTEQSDNEGKTRKINIEPFNVVQDMETENALPQKSTTITTSTTSSLVINPNLTNTIVKRQKKIDVSKFNKSNRKSKNCAIFYFKHMDTDTENNNENNGLTASEATKSDVSSEGEWYFTSTSEKPIVRRLDFESESQNAIGNEVKNDCPIQKVTKNIRNVNKEIIEKELDWKKTNNTPMFSAESIQKLVTEAETLVLEDVLRSSPKHNKNILNELTMSATIASNNCDSITVNKATKVSVTKNKKVQEWLEHQPKEASSLDMLLVVSSTDCEASGEYTDSDNAISRDTDTSEEVTDSVATCLKGGMTSEPGTSTEKLGESAEVIVGTSEMFSITATAQKSNVLMRNIKRPSDRPWSVSCISQLTRDSTGIDQCDGLTLNSKPKHSHQQDVSSFSISESAINTLYSQSSQSPNTTHSRNSLKRRRLRTKKRTDSKRLDSGSEDLTPRNGKNGLSKSESFSGKVHFGDDINNTNSFIVMTRSCHGQIMTTAQKDSSDERSTMMKPDFRIGEMTNLYGTCTSLNVGSLDFATTLQYDGSKIEKDGHGTEETSSFSEQAWDSYQEKYLSEPYSEDAADARHLLEFGDDYRNYLDSQSDNCSSLSAANIDSLSPKGHRKNVADNKKKAGSATPESSLELRYQRVLELPVSERFRKNSGKSDERRRSWNLNNYDSDKSERKADGAHARKFSESDSSSLRRRSARSGMLLRSISHQTNSSSCSSDIGEEDSEVKNLLLKTNDHLEHTKALRIHSHLLRPEDYKEIISTCQNNIHCLEAILTGPPGTVLSDSQCHTIKELLAAWEDLSKWSETTSITRQYQDEMSSLKTSIEKLGTKCTNFDDEVTIIEIINELKNDQLQMQTYRSNMLTLNATVHRWLTQQELNMNKMTTESVEVKTRTTLVQQGQKEVILSETEHINSEKGSQIDSYYDANLHNLLKGDVSEMYRMWDETNERIRCRLENLEASLIIWKQFENGLSQFQTTLDKDRGALTGLRSTLDTGETSDQNELISNIQQVAKLLSERIDNNIQISSDNVLYLDPGSAVLSSSDHLSDSGISDGDGGLSERERRLGCLRRLAKQLENSLAPGSHALKTIADRMEAAEQELRELQKTCRELIIKTAVAQDPTLENFNIDMNTPLPINVQMPVITIRNKKQRSPLSKRKNKRRSLTSTLVNSSQKTILSKLHTSEGEIEDYNGSHGCDTTDARIINNSIDDGGDENDDEKSDFKKRWISRIMSIAVPVQLAIITIFCVCCIFEPHCCDSLNNFSMSFSPQLRYIKGPPPV